MKLISINGNKSECGQAIRSGSEVFGRLARWEASRRWAGRTEGIVTV